MINRIVFIANSRQDFTIRRRVFQEGHLLTNRNSEVVIVRDTAELRRSIIFGAVIVNATTSYSGNRIFSGFDLIGRNGFGSIEFCRTFRQIKSRSRSHAFRSQ